MRQTNIRLGGINHLAIAIDNIDQTVEGLRAKGVAIASSPFEVPGSGGDRFAFIWDNERMLVDFSNPWAEHDDLA